ncbi:terminal deoxycytidyl transferase rev1 [Trichuris trichiura]|uniref:DNA repair protein REV1 n=1 Tax=Trichuris trichiura TaxID=36087 RepID=A0A077ZBL4_TRITR|nr:terminal deoxycytidyl transferase rev1 [Trichuris trichiura]
MFKSANSSLPNVAPIALSANKNNSCQEPPKFPRSRSAEDGNWKGWGEYMECKKSKLSAQFQKEASEYKDTKTIFKGISVYVNGYTEPPAAQLKRLILKHGGEYHIYRTSKTTHVIAANLAYAKVAKLKESDKVMRPEWITESVKAGCLLPERLYRLYSSCKPGSKLDDPGGMRKFVIPVENRSNEEPALPRQKTANVAVTSDPNFLQEFYDHSRLHFISTLAQELKSYVLNMRQTKKDRSGDRKRMQDSIESNRQGSSSDMGVSKFHPDDPFIAHLDLDCFFVSVSLQKYPELRGLPVVVAHSRGKGRVKDGHVSSWSEIASCNYEARSFGIRNGMLLGDAQKLCPSLKSLPYDFNRCKEVSTTFFSLVSRYTADIEAISCDEMYLNLKELCSSIDASSSEVISYLRREIYSTTGCSASAGIGPNKLVARLATRMAKPNGQYVVTSKQVSHFMEAISVGDLPGVGYSTLKKLKDLKVATCGDLVRLDLPTLVQRFGKKIGETLYAKARGIDSAPVQMEATKKSLSCDVNYGVRLKDWDETVEFVKKLSHEVSERMHRQSVEGRTFTLKLMIRAPEASVETMKFLGHGICDSVCKSVTIGTHTSSEPVIARTVVSLLRSLQPQPTDIRGVGEGYGRLKATSADLNNAPRVEEENTVTDVTVSNLGNAAPLEEKERASGSTASNFRSKQLQCEADKEVLDALPESIREKLTHLLAADGTAKRKRPQQQQLSEPPEEVAETESESSEPNTQCSLLIPEPSQIDQQVLEELPESIRKKIVRQIEQKRAKALDDRTPRLEFPFSSFDVYERFDPDEFKAVKQAVTSWIQSTTLPPPPDVFRVASFIVRLIYTKYLEMARNMMVYLREAMRKNPILKLPVETALESIQEIMVEEYGAPMAIDN